MKNIAIYYRVLSYQRRALDLLEKEFTVLEFERPGDETPDSLREASVLFAPLGYFLGEETLKHCFNLKVIASNTTGNAHIDVEAATRRDIRVATLADEAEFLGGITPTAEFTFALILALTRKLIPANQAVLAGEWERWPFGGHRMLSRMTIGIIGFGRLGRMLADYARGFGMRILAVDPYAGVDRLFVTEVQDILELASSSDIVSVHVPLNPKTKGFCDHKFFENIKKGSFFINTARGEVVDEGALLNSLVSGRVAGAACDVLAGEFNPSFSVTESPLWDYAKRHSNLILTPHIGGSTRDAWEETQLHTIKMAMFITQGES